VLWRLFSSNSISPVKYRFEMWLCIREGELCAKTDN